MAILSPAQKAALLDRLGQPDAAGLSDAGAADLLNAPATAPNPAPRGQVPKPFGFADVMGLLSAASVVNVRALPTATVLIEKINAQDRPGVQHWVAALSAPPALITAAEGQAVLGVLAATEPDPSWPATVVGPSWARATFPGVPFEHPGYTVTDQVTAAMVAEARS